MENQALYEAALRARQMELLDKVDGLEAALDQPGDPDMEEQAATRQGDEAQELLEAAAVSELKAIRRALARIAAGTFGRCRACGDEIEPGRLEAVPHADNCSACA